MEFFKHLEQLKELNLPKYEFAIFGSGQLGARKLRDTRDLDIIVKPALWERLILQHPARENKIINIGNLEIIKYWNPWVGESSELIDSAEWIGDFPFVRLEHVLTSKRKLDRAKDREDLKLIEAFLKSRETIKETVLLVEEATKQIEQII